MGTWSSAKCVVRHSKTHGVSVKKLAQQRFADYDCQVSAEQCSINDYEVKVVLCINLREGGEMAFHLFDSLYRELLAVFGHDKVLDFGVNITY